MENYSEKVAGLTDEQLGNYIEQRHRFNSDIVFAALIELQKRGRIFSDEEVQQIYADIEIKPGEEKKQQEPAAFVNEYADAPEYYSPLLIRVFSVLFSVLFGAVMMAINLSRANEKKAAVQVVVFGLIYTFALIIVGSFLPGGSGGIGIILNFAGGFMINIFSGINISARKLLM